MTSTNPYIDYALNEQVGKGREDFFASKKVAPVDGSFYDTSASLFEPDMTYTSVRLYHIRYVDVPPVSDPKFGRQLKWRIGQEGPAALLCVDALFTLPAVGNDQVCYQDYVGEQLLGDVKISYSNNVLRQYNWYDWHVYRRLIDEAYTAKSSAYKARVGAVQLARMAAQTQALSVPIWLPLHEEHGCSLLSAALPDTLTIELSIPKFRDLIVRRSPSDTGTLGGVDDVSEDDVNLDQVAEPAGFDVHLRLRYVEFEKVERSTYSLYATMNDGGYVWNILDTETQRDEKMSFKNTNADTDEVTRKIRISNIKNPCTLMAVTARYEADLAQSDGLGPQDAMKDTNDVSVSNPQKTALLPINYIQLFDGGQAFTERYTYRFVEDTIIPQMTRMEAGDNISMLPFSEFPLVGKHALGHVTLSSLFNPELLVAVRARPSEGSDDSDFDFVDPWLRSNGGVAFATVEAGKTNGQLDKVIDIICLTRNQIQQARGEVLQIFG